MNRLILIFLMALGTLSTNALSPKHYKTPPPCPVCGRPNCQCRHCTGHCYKCSTPRPHTHPRPAIQPPKPAPKPPKPNNPSVTRNDRPTYIGNRPNDGRNNPADSRNNQKNSQPDRKEPAKQTPQQNNRGGYRGGDRSASK